MSAQERLDVEKLTSGPIFNARTVSLCSQSFTDAVKRTHRIGASSFCASFTQTARVSGSAFVLSERLSLYVLHAGVVGVPNVHTDDYACTLFDEGSCRFDALLALFQHVTQRAKW